MLELDLAWILVDMPLHNIVAERLKRQVEVDFVHQVVQPVLHGIIERVTEGLGDRRDIPLLQAIGWKVGEVDLPFRPAKPHTLNQHTGPASVVR